MSRPFRIDLRRYRKTTGRDNQCVHWWLIDAPEGVRSKGVCKRCGATKMFRNSAPMMQWERDYQEHRYRIAMKSLSLEED